MHLPPMQVLKWHLQAHYPRALQRSWALQHLLRMRQHPLLKQRPALLAHL